MDEHDWNTVLTKLRGEHAAFEQAAKLVKYYRRQSSRRFAYMIAEAIGIVALLIALIVRCV